MLSGGLDAAYGFFNCIRYWLYGEIRPLWMGHTSMAFSTAALPGVVIGLAVFWTGWYIWDREREQRRPHEPLPTHMIPILCAAISGVSLIIVALIGALTRR